MGKYPAQHTPRREVFPLGAGLQIERLLVSGAAGPGSLLDLIDATAGARSRAGRKNASFDKYATAILVTSGDGDVAAAVFGLAGAGQR